MRIKGDINPFKKPILLIILVFYIADNVSLKKESNIVS
jgi:hypothetical protein